VLFCGLFGGMNELPFAFPHLCLDIKQLAIELGNPDLPPQLDSSHHALVDARWTREAWGFLAGIEPTVAERQALGRKHPMGGPPL
jgi:hypothetical protein